MAPEEKIFELGDNEATRALNRKQKRVDNVEVIGSEELSKITDLRQEYIEEEGIEDE